MVAVKENGHPTPRHTTCGADSVWSLFYTLQEAQIVIESWRRHYNTIRPHASLGYKPPAPEVFVPAFAAWPAALRRPASPAHAGATANLKLTFHPDHSVGANQAHTTW